MSPSDDHDPREVMHDHVTETEEEVAEYWRTREPIIARQDEAALRFAPTVVGDTIAAARERVERAATNAGVELTIRFVEHAATEEYVYGRVTAWVRDGIVVSAQRG